MACCFRKIISFWEIKVNLLHHTKPFTTAFCCNTHTHTRQVFLPILTLRECHIINRDKRQYNAFMVIWIFLHTVRSFSCSSSWTFSSTNAFSAAFCSAFWAALSSSGPPELFCCAAVHRSRGVLLNKQTKHTYLSINAELWLHRASRNPATNGSRPVCASFYIYCLQHPLYMFTLTAYTFSQPLGRVFDFDRYPADVNNDTMEVSECPQSAHCGRGSLCRD